MLYLFYYLSVSFTVSFFLKPPFVYSIGISPIVDIYVTPCLVSIVVSAQAPAYAPTANGDIDSTESLSKVTSVSSSPASSSNNSNSYSSTSGSSSSDKNSGSSSTNNKASGGSSSSTSGPAWVDTVTEEPSNPASGAIEKEAPPDASSLSSGVNSIGQVIDQAEAEGPQGYGNDPVSVVTEKSKLETGLAASPPVSISIAPSPSESSSLPGMGDNNETGNTKVDESEPISVSKSDVENSDQTNAKELQPALDSVLKVDSNPQEGDGEGGLDQVEKNHEGLQQNGQGDVDSWTEADTDGIPSPSAHPTRKHRKRKRKHGNDSDDDSENDSDSEDSNDVAGHEGGMSDKGDEGRDGDEDNENDREHSDREHSDRDHSEQDSEDPEEPTVGGRIGGKRRKRVPTRTPSSIPMLAPIAMDSELGDEFHPNAASTTPAPTDVPPTDSTVHTLSRGEESFATGVEKLDGSESIAGLSESGEEEEEEIQQEVKEEERKGDQEEMGFGFSQLQNEMKEQQEEFAGVGQEEIESAAEVDVQLEEDMYKIYGAVLGVVVVLTCGWCAR